MARMTPSALALGVTALALAGPAGGRDISIIEGWQLSTTGKTCTMVSTFADDVSVGLLLTPQTGELGFVTTVPHPNDLRGKATAPLQISFDGDAPYIQWEDDRATVITGPDSDAVVASWGAAHSDELAQAMKSASHVKLRVGDKDIGTYDLSGSPAAYRALTRCGDQIAVK